MGIVLRAVSFLVLAGVIWTGDIWLNEVVAPRQSSLHAIAALNGGESEAARVRTYEHYKDAIAVGACALTAAAFLLCIGTYAGKPRITYARRV